MRAVRSIAVGVATLGMAAAVAAPASAAAHPTTYRGANRNVYLAHLRYQARTGTGTGGEYVKITNGHDYSVDLRHWTLSEHHGDRLYVFPDKWLAPHASLWLYSGRGQDRGANLFWGSGTQVWNDTADTAVLRNGRGTLIDTVQWKQRGTGYVDNVNGNR